MIIITDPITENYDRVLNYDVEIKEDIFVNNNEAIFAKMLHTCVIRVSGKQCT